MNRTIRDIRVADYGMIYALNQQFNPTFSSFSAERVKQKIKTLTTRTKDVVFVCEQNDEVSGTYTVAHTSFSLQMRWSTCSDLSWMKHTASKGSAAC